jgi:hypothetical protein
LTAEDGVGSSDDHDKAFRDERYGPGAGITTSLGGTLGQISARQQKHLESGRVSGGAGGMLIIEMLAGGLISRGILVLVVGFMLGVGVVSSGLRSLFAVGILLGSLAMLAGCAMIALGVVRKLRRPRPSPTVR